MPRKYIFWPVVGMGLIVVLVAARPPNLLPDLFDTTFPTEEELDARKISWQSISWTITVLALTAMTQSSAADHLLPAGTLSPARSSAVICAADIVVTLIWVLAGCSFQAPFQALAHARHQLRVGYGDDRDYVESLKNGAPSASIAFFIVGPLPQMLKLLTFHESLPLFTRASAIAFVAVYLMTIVVRFWPQPPPSERLSTHLGPNSSQRTVRGIQVQTLIRLSHSIYQSAFILQLLMWVYVLFTTAELIVSSQLALLATAASLLISPVLACCFLRHKDERVALLTLCVAFVLNLILIIMVSSDPVAWNQISTTAQHYPHFYLTDDAESSMRYYYLAALAVAYIRFGAMLLLAPLVLGLVAAGTKFLHVCDGLVKKLGTFGVNKIVKHSPAPSQVNFFDIEGVTNGTKTRGRSNSTVLPPPEPLVEKKYAMGFALMNLICMVLWYRFRYDPTGTFRAQWTDMLG